MPCPWFIQCGSDGCQRGICLPTADVQAIITSAAGRIRRSAEDYLTDFPSIFKERRSDILHEGEPFFPAFSLAYRTLPPLPLAVCGGISGIPYGSAPGRRRRAAARRASPTIRGLFDPAPPPCPAVACGRCAAGRSTRTSPQSRRARSRRHVPARIQPIDVPCTFPEVELVHYFTRLGPLGLALQQADEATRGQIIEAVRPAFDPYVHVDEVRFTAACWMVGARAPA